MIHNLNETFDIESTPVIKGDLIASSGEIVIPHGKIEENIDNDYERARANLHNLLEQGQCALMTALDVARQSEHPRAFEVVGNLVKQLADINHQLLDLSEKRQKISVKKEETTNQITNNNAFFVGSTTELNKMLKRMANGSD